MSLDELLATIRTFEGVLELAPTEGGPYPPIAWGDHFFYYAPDGGVPQNQQPYATVVTKDYPDDDACGLDDPGRWRLNPRSQGWVCIVNPGPRTEDLAVRLLAQGHEAVKRRTERRSDLSG